MSIAFDAVRTADDRQRLAALADEIWHEYWPALIGDAQTDYMVENFQSLGAIERDLREHAYEYWFLRAEDDGRIVGYTGGRARGTAARRRRWPARRSPCRVPRPAGTPSR